MSDPFANPLFVAKALYDKVKEKYPNITDAKIVELINLVAGRMAPGERMSPSRMFLEICEQYQGTHD